MRKGLTSLVGGIALAGACLFGIGRSYAGGLDFNRAMSTLHRFKQDEALQKGNIQEYNRQRALEALSNDRQESQDYHDNQQMIKKSLEEKAEKEKQFLERQILDIEKERVKIREESGAQEVKSTSQPSLEQELQNKVIFTANRWIDLNTNGTIDYNEFQGVKNSFEEGEEMRICVQNNSPNSRKFMEVIYGPNGKVIRDKNDVFKPFKVCGAPPENWDNIFKPMLERGGIGSYKVAVYFDDKLAAVHDFEIRRKSNN